MFNDKGLEFPRGNPILEKILNLRTRPVPRFGKLEKQVDEEDDVGCHPKASCHVSAQSHFQALNGTRKTDKPDVTPQFHAVVLSIYGTN